MEENFVQGLPAGSNVTPDLQLSSPFFSAIEKFELVVYAFALFRSVTLLSDVVIHCGRETQKKAYIGARKVRTSFDCVVCSESACE